MRARAPLLVPFALAFLLAGCATPPRTQVVLQRRGPEAEAEWRASISMCLENPWRLKDVIWLIEGDPASVEMVPLEEPRGAWRITWGPAEERSALHILTRPDRYVELFDPAEPVTREWNDTGLGHHCGTFPPRSPSEIAPAMDGGLDVFLAADGSWRLYDLPPTGPAYFMPKRPE